MALGEIRDPLRPPVKRTQSEIAKAAARLERLKLRRRRLVQKVSKLDDEIREAGKLLRAIIDDATQPVVRELGVIGEVPETS